MTSTLEVYREFVSTPDRQVSVRDLEKRGLSRGHARVMLSRLRKEGAAESVAPGRVRLLAPGEAKPKQPHEGPLVRELARRGAKPTGFSVLPRRYPGPRPEEFLVRPGGASSVADYVRRRHPGLRVRVGSYEPGERTVCLYPARVRGDKATVEEALVHVFRHAPRAEFALALQTVLQETTDLNWRWLQTQPEWPELAGVFVAINDLAGRRVFPEFRNAEPPSLSYDELETAAQPVVARESQHG